MQNTKSKTYGILGGLIIIANVLLMAYVWKMPMTGFPQMVALILYIVIIILSLLSFYRDVKTTVGLKAYFSEGFKTFAVMAFLLLIFTFIYYKLNTGILEKGITDNDKLLLAEGNHTPQEIEENSGKLRSIFMPMMLSITTITLLITGCVVSLVTGAILKNRQPAK